MPSRSRPRRLLDTAFHDNLERRPSCGYTPRPKALPYRPKRRFAQRIHMSEYFTAPRVGLAALAAATIMLAACNQGGTPTASSAASSAAAPTNDVVATVNGTGISRTAYDVYTKSLLEGKNPPPELTSEQKGQILDQLISMQLLSAQGEKDVLDKSPDVLARMQLVRMRILSDQESIKYIKDHEPT